MNLFAISFIKSKTIVSFSCTYIF